MVGVGEGERLISESATNRFVNPGWIITGSSCNFGDSSPFTGFSHTLFPALAWHESSSQHHAQPIGDMAIRAGPHGFAENAADQFAQPLRLDAVTFQVCRRPTNQVTFPTTIIALRTMLNSIAWAFVLFFGLAGMTFAQSDLSTLYSEVPDNPEGIDPIQVGELLPKLIVRDIDNQPFDLNAAISRQPTILIFYRGGWCPYCNAHLSGLVSIESDLREMGFQLFAISPDRPEKLRESVKTHDLEYSLFSDSDMSASIALGIAYRVDGETVERYLEHGIDLEGDSGHDHHLLPVPAALVVNTDGKVGFAYINPDYKVRIENDRLLDAAADATEGR